MKKYTLVDIEKGRVLRFENYLSALNYRQTVDSGIICRDDCCIVTVIVETIRAMWCSDCYTSKNDNL